METVYMNAALLAEEFVQVFNKADDNDDGCAGHPDEKEIRQQVHSEIDECAHTSILPRSGILRRIVLVPRDDRLTLNALFRPQAHSSRIALSHPSRLAVSYRRAHAAMARRVFLGCSCPVALWIARGMQRRRSTLSAPQRARRLRLRSSLVHPELLLDLRHDAPLWKCAAA